MQTLNCSPRVLSRKYILRCRDEFVSVLPKSDMLLKTIGGPFIKTPPAMTHTSVAPFKGQHVPRLFPFDRPKNCSRRLLGLWEGSAFLSGGCNLRVHLPRNFRYSSTYRFRSLIIFLMHRTGLTRPATSSKTKLRSLWMITHTDGLSMGIIEAI